MRRQTTYVPSKILAGVLFFRSCVSPMLLVPTAIDTSWYTLKNGLCMALMAEYYLSLAPTFARSYTRLAPTYSGVGTVNP